MQCKNISTDISKLTSLYHLRKNQCCLHFHIHVNISDLKIGGILFEFSLELVMTLD